MKKLIKNFVNSDPVEICTLESNNHIFVLVRQCSGSMSFQHTMTIDQCREMAEALTQTADEAQSMMEVEA